MKHTKIVCTVGPASGSAKVIRALAEAGMNVARLNFSHGTHEEHASWIQTIREVSAELNRPIAILQDLSGPKLRIGEIESDNVVLKEGEKLTLTNRDVPGNEKEISISYPTLPNIVKIGDQILLADGVLELRVMGTTAQDIICKVIVGGELSSHKGLNLPKASCSIPSVTQKDIKDLKFGLEHDVDWIALSFVQRSSDVLKVKQVVNDKEKNTPVIAKIEKREAVERIDEIIDVADGVMIARGDLGIETPIEEVPLIQKKITKKANELGKPTIIATQMLESMIDNPRPTRAEVTDIANAIFDGTDAVMLSGETAIGDYPIQAVKVMASVAGKTEEQIEYVENLERHTITPERNLPDAISHAACHIALNISADAIVCCTRSGQTARMTAKYRPHAKIIAVTESEATLRRLSLVWGVQAVLIGQANNTDELIAEAKQAIIANHLLPKGSSIVIVAGIPVGMPGTTNMIKGDVLSIRRKKT